MRLHGHREQADIRPLARAELVYLHCLASQTLVAIDLVGQGDDLARAS